MLIERLADQLGYAGGMERASDHFFPYVDHIGPATLLLSDGSVLGVLRMPGAPFSLALNGTRNGHKRRLVAFLNAVADENVEVHIHLVKHDAALPPASHGDAVAPYAQRLLGDYHASIQDDLAVPYLVHMGTQEQKEKWLPRMATGEVLGALAMTDPGAGSDLRGIKTNAKKVDGGYLVR